jgi:1-acyl-sn-glycerol-3-phosphate acyltransferase
MLAALAAVCWIYFFVFNRTTVRRRDQRIGPNTLLVANHQSSIDSVLVAFATCHPRCWLEPRLLPWNLAAAEFFFRTAPRAWFADQLKCIPVAPGRRDPVALRRVIDVLPDGVAVFFPEGRRSPCGTLMRAEPGVGLVALATGPRVIPVAVDGTNEAIRLDRFGLRFFRRLAVSVGPALDLSSLRGRRPTRADAQEIADRLMDAVACELLLARAARGVSPSGPSPRS